MIHAVEFSVVLTICYIRLGAATSKAVHSALIFFADIAIAGFNNICRYIFRFLVSHDLGINGQII